MKLSELIIITMWCNKKGLTVMVKGRDETSYFSPLNFLFLRKSSSKPILWVELTKRERNTME